MILLFHGSKGINKVSKQYIRFLSSFDTVICPLFVKPDTHPCISNLRYISKVRNILRDERRYKCLYSFIRKKRQEHARKVIDKYKIYNPIIVGISEGAIGISGLRTGFRKKILIGYSGEQNYFTFQKQPLSLRRPTLILLGSDDPFFSSSKYSVASQISKKGKTFPKHKIRGKPRTSSKHITFCSIQNKKHNVFCQEVKRILKFFL